MLQNSNLRRELLVNRLDLHTSQLAAMTHSPMVSLAPLILESDHLFVFELFNHFTDHLCPGNNRITGCDGRSVSEQNDISESNLLSIGGCEFVNRYGLPGAHLYCLPPERIIAYAMLNVQSERRRNCHSPCRLTNGFFKKPRIQGARSSAF